MCGIVVAMRKNTPCKRLVSKRYEEQKSRGSNGFGYIGIKDGYISSFVRTKGEKEILEKLEREKCPIIMFHHRLPTSTPNFEDANHPIPIISDKLKHNYYVIHNGVITNDQELFEEHQALGYNYSTYGETATISRIGKKEQEKKVEYFYNDSECFGVELALFLEGKKNVLTGVRGSIAFVCIETDKDGKVLFIHYGRNYGNPLKLETGNDYVVLRSEGAGEEIKVNTLFTVDLFGNKLAEKDLEIGRQYAYNSATYHDDDDDLYGYHDHPIRGLVKSEYLPMAKDIIIEGKVLEGDRTSWRDFTEDEETEYRKLAEMENSKNAMAYREASEAVEDAQDEMEYYQGLVDNDQTMSREDRLYAEESVKDLKDTIKTLDAKMDFILREMEDDADQSVAGHTMWD